MQRLALCEGGTHGVFALAEDMATDGERAVGRFNSRSVAEFENSLASGQLQHLSWHDANVAWFRINLSSASRSD